MKLYTILLLLFASSLLMLTGCDDPDENGNGDNPQPEPTLEPIIYDCSSGTVTDDLIWTNDPNRPVDYRVTCRVRFQSGGNLTIEPGTVIEFTEDGSLFFDNGSEFHLNGTATDSIYLIGTQAQPGHWGGIEHQTDNITNNMDFVTIRDAGRASAADGNHVMRFRQNTGAYVAMNDVTFENNRGIVLLLERQADMSGSNNLSFINNTGVPVKANFRQMGNLTNSCVFINNGTDYVEAFNNSVPDESVNTDVSITFNVLPIHMSRIKMQDGAKLSLGAGVQLLFSPDGELDLGSGWIEAIGTAASPVVFDAIEPSQGWRGIGLQDKDFTHTITHAIVTNGGNAKIYPFQGDDNAANIFLREEVTANLTNVEISNSKTYGITLRESNSTINETNVTYINNAEGDVHTIDP